MAITNGNKKLLDPKRWEFMAPNPIGSPTDGTCIISSKNFKQKQFLYYNNGNAAMYDPFEDGWVYLPAPGIATGGNGTCGAAACWSTGTRIGVSSLSAVGGSVSSITTDQFLARDLSGYSVHIMEGPNAGKMLTITSSTVGPSSIINFDTQVSAFDASTRFRLMTPRVYALGTGALASGTGFRVYDYATNSWLGLAVAGFHGSIGTDSKLIPTPSLELDPVVFHSFVATSANTTQIQSNTANWAASSWSNYQVRIASGTGAGQVFPIATNDATTLTISGTWAITPSTDSSAVLEGCDDFLYYIGNSNVGLYRYRISTNTWSLITPVVARAGAPSTGMSGQWIHNVKHSSWRNPNDIKNGRYIYSFRAGGSAALDVYDIALNTWINQYAYAPGFVGLTSGTSDTFTTGSKFCYNGDYIYITKENTGRFFKLDLVKREMIPWGYLLYPQSTNRTGDTLFDVTFREGNTEILYIYFLGNTILPTFRCMDI